MIGSASPAMHKHIWRPAAWVFKHKVLKGGHYSLIENNFISQQPTTADNMDLSP
jgi:hypothetical protein